MSLSEISQFETAIQQYTFGKSSNMQSFCLAVKVAVLTRIGNTWGTLHLFHLCLMDVFKAFNTA